MTETAPLNPRSRLVAAVLAVICPGLGYAYLNRLQRVLLFNLSIVAVLVIGTVGDAIFSSRGFWFVVFILLAIRCSLNDINRRMEFATVDYEAMKTAR